MSITLPYLCLWPQVIHIPYMYKTEKRSSHIADKPTPPFPPGYSWYARSNQRPQRQSVYFPSHGGYRFSDAKWWPGNRKPSRLLHSEYRVIWVTKYIMHIVFMQILFERSQWTVDFLVIIGLSSRWKGCMVQMFVGYTVFNMPSHTNYLSVLVIFTDAQRLCFQKHNYPHMDIITVAWSGTNAICLLWKYYLLFNIPNHKASVWHCPPTPPSGKRRRFLCNPLPPIPLQNWICILISGLVSTWMKYQGHEY